MLQLREMNHNCKIKSHIVRFKVKILRNGSHNNLLFYSEVEEESTCSWLLDWVVWISKSGNTELVKMRMKAC